MVFLPQFHVCVYLYPLRLLQMPWGCQEKECELQHTYAINRWEDALIQSWIMPLKELERSGVSINQKIYRIQVVQFLIGKPDRPSWNVRIEL